MSEAGNASRELVARQTWRPIVSLEAALPGRGIPRPLRVNFISHFRCSPFTKDTTWPHRRFPLVEEHLASLGSLWCEGEEMLLTGKIVWSGIAFLLVATGFSGLRAAAPRAAANLIQEAPTFQHQNDARSAQQALHDRGHYSGKVDGAFGLRTRASIRAYQKAENLPITGQVDAQTAAGLGVRPESTRGTFQSVGGEVGHRDKPSAGIKLAKRRTSKAQSKQIAQERNAIDADGDNGDNK
jgi:hypothetical protein